MLAAKRRSWHGVVIKENWTGIWGFKNAHEVADNLTKWEKNIKLLAAEASGDNFDLKGLLTTNEGRIVRDKAVGISKKKKPEKRITTGDGKKTKVVKNRPIIAKDVPSRNPRPAKRKHEDLEKCSKRPGMCG